MSDHRAMIAYIQNDCWALESGVMDRAVEIFNRQLADEKLVPSEIQAITANKGSTREFTVTKGTAVIPITGVIAKGAGMVNNVSQPRGTAVETIRAQLRDAMSDEDVERIMLHVDSPGGSVAGITDMANEIRSAAGKKPLTAFIEDTGASAAFWLASQASQVFANASAAVGSIGVYAVVVDSSEAAAKAGLKFHVIRSGPLKGAGEVGDAITEDQIASFQERIDDVFDLFVDDVATGRGLDREKVLAVADGSVFTGRKAKRAKLVDAITDFSGALKRTAKLTLDARRAARAERKEPAMATEQEKAAAAEALAANEQKDAVEKAQAETEAKERKRAADIMGAVSDFPEVMQAAIADGLTVDQAKAKAFDVCQAQLGEAKTRLKSIETAGTAPAPVGADEDAETEPDPNTKPGDDGKASTYQARLDQLRAEKQTTARCHSIATRELPRSKQAWVDESQKN